MDCNAVRTECTLYNKVSQTERLVLDIQKYWNGHSDPPTEIQSHIKFTHYGDVEGSIGAVLYDFGESLMWIVSWSNKEAEDNKVYTKIFKPEPCINWHDVKTSLDQSSSISCSKYLEFEATVVIDASHSPAKLTATIKAA